LPRRFKQIDHARQKRIVTPIDLACTALFAWHYPLPVQPKPVALSSLRFLRCELVGWNFAVGTEVFSLRIPAASVPNFTLKPSRQISLDCYSKENRQSTGAQTPAATNRKKSRDCCHVGIDSESKSSIALCGKRQLAERKAEVKSA
jgi:hypothetical protein